MKVPKQVVSAILSESVTRCRVPLDYWAPKKTEVLRSSREIRDDKGYIIDRKTGDDLCRLKVLRYHVAELDRTTNADAKREGYKSRGELERAYLDAYGGAWTDQHCWVITFAIDKAEPVRLLQRVAGYTTSSHQALEMEPEAIDPEIITKLPATMEAQQRWTRDRVHRESLYNDGTLTERLDRALAFAKANRIDTSGIERLIQRKVTELERRNERAA